MYSTPQKPYMKYYQSGFSNKIFTTYEERNKDTCIIPHETRPSENICHWKKSSNNKWWLKFDWGGYAKSEWKNLKGKWYYFDNQGYMVTGWKKINGIWYWFKKSGDINNHIGWEKCKHGWAYSLGYNGYYTNTTKVIDGVIYYFDTNAYAHKR